MQFGVFSVSDITTDPTTGRTPTEHERIKAIVEIAKKSEEVGLDVFALGEHHNPPFFSSSPTTTLGFIAAQTERIILSTATTLITTNDPVKIAEDYATLQHLVDGRMDLMLGRGNTAPVYPWFGKDMGKAIELTIENYQLLRRLWTEELVTYEGQWHQLDRMGINPLPVQRPIPIWMGGGAVPAVLERIGRLGDGWLAHEPRAGESVTEAMALVRASAERAGRDPDAIGLQGRIDVHGPLDRDRFHRSLDAWLAAGATHLSLHANGQGGAPAHLELVPTFADLVREHLDLPPKELPT